MKIGFLISLLLVHSCTLAFVPPKQRRASIGQMFAGGDGNPPPFGSWGQPAPAPASPWGAPPPAPAPPATPDFSSWGQPAVASTPPATPDASSLGQPATAAAPAATAVSGEPIAALAQMQQALVDKIAASIPDLAVKPDLSWASETIASSPARLDARDAPGQSNIAWLGSVTVDGTLSSLTIFNGPLTDVPHILSRCVVNGNNELEVCIDIRPRAYGAYETKDASGNYPGPEQLGRKAFEYSGARNDFFTKFGTDALQSALDPSQFDGATDLPQSELDLLTGGPLALHVKMPNTPDNLNKIAATRDMVANAWLEWALQDGNDHRPGAPVNTQYVYDAKFRQNAYSALLPYYSNLFGASDGAKLAAAESGPLDEAYVGGGS